MITISSSMSTMLRRDVIYLIYHRFVSIDLSSSEDRLGWSFSEGGGRSDRRQAGLKEGGEEKRVYLYLLITGWSYQFITDLYLEYKKNVKNDTA